MLPKAQKNLKLNRPGRRRLREALLGAQGYGLPVKQRGYRLVGAAHGRLEPLFDRNDHQKVPLTPRFPDADDLAWGAMSREFWDRFMERLEEIKKGHWKWRNIWHPKPTVLVEVLKEVKSGKYLYIPVRRKDTPLRMLISSSALRMRVTSTKAETAARKRLNKALNGRQRRELLLNAGFVEEGQSGVHYLIRANRPTVAYREEKLPDRMRSIHFLAALCLHPLGYYEDTFTGCMPPSDEMITHLLMIRADEHFYWRKCNQHGEKDSRSGL